MLIVYLLLLLLVLGCQEKQKPASLERSLMQQQKNELEEQILATCDDYSTRMTFEATPRDITIARNPGIEQKLYLTAVDKEGKPIACEKPMRIMVDNDGRLLLKCPGGSEFKPIAVKDDKVVAEQI